MTRTDDLQAAWKVARDGGFSRQDMTPLLLAMPDLLVVVRAAEAVRDLLPGEVLDALAALNREPA